MLKRKRARERGKLSLGKYFQELHEGERVAVIRNLSYPANFPARLQGKTGTIIEKRGKAFAICLNDGRKEKHFVIKKMHLKKLQMAKRNK